MTVVPIMLSHLCFFMPTGLWCFITTALESHTPHQSKFILGVQLILVKWFMGQWTTEWLKTVPLRGADTHVHIWMSSCQVTQWISNSLSRRITS
jgi:hypothetical protein